MPYWQLFYHIVTATQNRQPLITPEIEPGLFSYIQSKIYHLKGTIFAINGIADHVHLVVSIPPSIAVSAFIGQVKGFSANQLRKQFPDFAWQEEYGVFSFDQKRLSACVAYVEGQKEHHLQGNLIPTLERYQQTPGQVAEDSTEYVTSIPDWPFSV